MANLWERIRMLEGQTLTTVTGRGVFEVVAVTGDHVRIVLHGRGTTRRLPREQFQRAEELGLDKAVVTPSQIREAGVSEFDPAYVAAIIRIAMGYASLR